MLWKIRAKLFLRRALKFFNRLSDNVVIVPHWDADGVISAVFVKRILESLGKDWDLKYCKTIQVGKVKGKSILFVDHQYDVPDLEKFYKEDLWIFDHHPIVQARVLPKYKILSQRPYLPTLSNALLAALVYSEITKNYDPILLSLGAYTDAAYYESLPLLKALLGKKLSLVHSRGYLSTFLSRLFRIAYVASFVLDEKVFLRIFDLFDRFVGYIIEGDKESLLNLIEESEEFEVYFKEKDDRIIKKLRELKVIHYDKRIFIGLIKENDKLRIYRFLFDPVKVLYPSNYYVLIVDEGKPDLNVSARGGIKENVFNVVIRATREVGGVGGGHKSACGGRIPRNSLQEFVNLVVKYASR